MTEREETVLSYLSQQVRSQVLTQLCIFPQGCLCGLDRTRARFKGRRGERQPVRIPASVHPTDRR